MAGLNQKYRIRRAWVLCVALLSGCERNQTPGEHKPPTSPTSPTATQPVAHAAVPGDMIDTPPLLVESRLWSKEQAAAHLSDAAAAISAAVRLIELEEPESPHAQGDWTLERVNRVRVLSISDDVYVFGIVDESNAKLLAQGVRIAADGSLETINIEGMPGARMYVSPDGDLFPSLLISERQIRMLSDLDAEALTIELPDALRFDIQEQDEIAGVSLMLKVGDESREVARYRWDPYELTFIGPACDKLPDPPGGKFQLDLKRSAALTPMGGELPPPPKVDDNQRPVEKEGPIY